MDIYKIIVVGDSNVGKTSLINFYQQGNIIQEYVPTIGIEFYTKNEKVEEDKEISLQIWDTVKN